MHIYDFIFYAHARREESSPISALIDWTSSCIPLFTSNNISVNQIDDNKDSLSSLTTDTTTLSNKFDDYSEEQAKVCETVCKLMMDRLNVITIFDIILNY